VPRLDFARARAYDSSMDQAVAAFIRHGKGDQRALHESLHALVRKLYPAAVARISYGVPMYKTDSGWVGLGYWKGGASIYCGIVPALDRLRAEHPHIKVNKGSVNLKTGDRLPLAAIKRLIRDSMERKQPRS
jgi:uncharacterized protein YdhG (YjbR/CyaY superfamily)